MHPYIYILIIQVIIENMNQALEMLKKTPQKHNKEIWSNLKQVGWGLQERVCVDSIIKC